MRALLLVLALALPVALGAQQGSTCDSTVALALRAQTDTVRSEKARYEIILQPAFLRSKLDTVAQKIDSIVQRHCQNAPIVPPPPPPPPPSPVGAFLQLGSAEVPRVRLNPTRPAGTYRPIPVTSCAGIQSAINAAVAGDELQITAGLRCALSLTLPSKPLGAQPVIITTAGVTHTLGERIRPTTAAQRQLARIDVPSNGAAAVVAAPNAKGYRIEALEFGYADVVTTSNAIVILGTLNATPMDSTVSDIALIGVYVHGRPDATLRRCVMVQGQRQIIEDSWLDDCHEKGADSQAIIGWNGAGPYRIVNNYLAGAGENVMFGGASPSRPSNVPSDIEIGRNHFHTPPSWKTIWTKKNLFELKTARRVIIYENESDGSWTDGQIGMAWTIKTAPSGPCRACSTSDVTFVDNVVRNVAGFLSLTGNLTTSPTDSTTRRITITRTLLEEQVATAPYSPSSTITRLVSLIGPMHDVEITDSRTVDYAVTPTEALLFSAGPPIQNLVVRNWALKKGTYGIFGSGVGEGLPAWTQYAPNGTISGMVLVGSSTRPYPTGVTFVPSVAATAGLGLNIAALKAKLVGVVVPP